MMLLLMDQLWLIKQEKLWTFSHSYISMLNFRLKDRDHVFSKYLIMANFSLYDIFFFAKFSQIVSKCLQF